MKSPFPAIMQRMAEALEKSPGATAQALRRRVLDRALALASAGAARGGGGIPAEIAGYAETIAMHAYRVTDADIAALKAAGYSEDAILEITYSAALGAGLARMEAGRAALFPPKGDR
jgi:alkylhydroperoxidase family enzyme